MPYIPPPPPSYRPDPNAARNMMELIMNRGRIASEGAQQSGNIWANALSNIGQTISGGLQQYAVEGERKKQSIAFEAAIQSGDPRRIISVLGPERGPAVITALRASTPDGMKAYTDRMALGRDLSRGVLATPEDMRPQAYTFARTQALSAGAFKPEELPEAFEEALPILNQVANYGREPAKPGEAFTLNPGDVRYGPDGQPIAAAPAAPPDPRVVGRDLVDPATGRVIHRAPAEPRAVESPSLQRVETADGIRTFNPRTGEVGPVIAQPPAPARASRPPTGVERTALGFYNRAAQAFKDADEVADKVGAGLGDQARLAYEGPGSNYVKSPEQQQYRQAQRAFTEARLRKDSGAAIPEHEYAKDAQTYFKQPGDSPEVLAQKNAARQVALESMMLQSGKAYEEYYGEPMSTPRSRGQQPPPETPAGAPRVGSVVRGYRYKGGDPASRSSWEKE